MLHVVPNAETPETANNIEAHPIVVIEAGTLLRGRLWRLLLPLLLNELRDMSIVEISLYSVRASACNFFEPIFSSSNRKNDANENGNTRVREFSYPVPVHPTYSMVS